MITLFENLFHDNAIKFSNNEDQTFILSEQEREDYAGYALDIARLPRSAYMVDLDNNFSVERIFNGSHSEAKRPDYLIVDPENSIACVIELKGGNIRKRRADIINQLKGGEAFLKYCESVIKIFAERGDVEKCTCPCEWCNQTYESHKYKIRYVCIYGLGGEGSSGIKKGHRSAGSPKRRVVPPLNENIKSKAIVENTPDNFAKFGPGDIVQNNETGHMQIYWNKVLYG